VCGQALSRSGINHVTSEHLYKHFHEVKTVSMQQTQCYTSKPGMTEQKYLVSEQGLNRVYEFSLCLVTKAEFVPKLVPC